MDVFELNMDGLVGATHHYAGLSPGNIASSQNALSIANPRAAVKQGLEKMRLLMSMGIKQALLPPHQRPNLHLLYQLGFSGTPTQQITQAKRHAPELLSACYSASSMWTANAATVSASIDTADNKVHFTAANLVNNLHRHQEADFSSRLLQRIFADQDHFHHHPVLPRSMGTGDEGAANHSRLCASHDKAAVSLFVYGKQALNHQLESPHKFPARQTLEASTAVARSHRLNPDRVVFARQNSSAIDQGVFHNDVIAVANERVLFLHQHAFANQQRILEELRAKVDFPLIIIEAHDHDFTLSDAVSSYVFNSQLISTADNQMMLIAPTECEQNPRVLAFILQMIAQSDNPVNLVHFLDLKQSMRNGGGPACLRLRVLLNSQEINAMHQGIMVSNDLLNQLNTWADTYYRDRLHADDLADPALIDEVLTGFDVLTQILHLGSLYPFQLE